MCGCHTWTRTATVRSSPKPQRRREVYERDGYRCRYCGREPHSKITLDHVLPKQAGGPNTPWNLVCCCWPCQKRKKNRTPEEAGMTLHPIGQVPTPPRRPDLDRLTHFYERSGEPRESLSGWEAIMLNRPDHRTGQGRKVWWCDHCDGWHVRWVRAKNRHRRPRPRRPDDPRDLVTLRSELGGRAYTHMMDESTGGSTKRLNVIRRRAAVVERKLSPSRTGTVDTLTL